MQELQVYLFGKFQIRCDGQHLTGFEARKPQELLSYLLLHRNKSHRREALAELLWEDSSHNHARKNLRQSLWQIQTGFNGSGSETKNPIFSLDQEWIELDACDDLWLDVQKFEDVYDGTFETPGRELTAEKADQIKAAVELYRGDLLEGWYHDWCLFERERLQLMYLTMLDKLIGHCERIGDYPHGLSYGARILSLDRASERGHRRMMRLYYLAGRRTQALRQYDTCASALDEELSVAPGQSTKVLREQIRLDSLAVAGTVLPQFDATTPTNGVRNDEVEAQLAQIQTALSQLQHQVQACRKALDQSSDQV